MSKKIACVAITLILVLMIVSAPVQADATVNITPSGLPKTDATFVVTYNGDITGIVVVTPDNRTYSASSNGEGLASTFIGNAPAGTYKLTLQGTFISFGVTIVGTTAPTPTNGPTPTTMPTPTQAPPPTATPTTQSPTPTPTPTTEPTTAATGETTAATTTTAGPDPTGSSPSNNATDPTSQAGETTAQDPTGSSDPDDLSGDPTSQDPTGSSDPEPTYGWDQGYTPTPEPNSGSAGQSLDLPGETITYIAGGVLSAALLFLLVKKRVFPRIFAILFRKKGMLTEKELLLKERYEQRLSAEEKLLKDTKPKQGTDAPKNKEE